MMADNPSQQDASVPSSSSPRTIAIVQDGDLRLRQVVNQDIIDFQVDSKAISSGSPSLERMVHESMAESRAPGEDFVIVLPCHSIGPLGTILKIIHGQTDSVKRSISLESLKDILLLAETHEVSHLLRPFTRAWLEAIWKRVDMADRQLDAQALIYVGYQLGEEELFLAGTHHLTIGCSLRADGSLADRRGNIVSDAMLCGGVWGESRPWPARAAPLEHLRENSDEIDTPSTESILSARISALKAVLQEYQEWIEDFLLEHRPCQHEVLAQCDAHLLGNFLMPMMKADPEFLVRSAAAVSISVEQLFDTLSTAITQPRAPPALSGFLQSRAAKYVGFIDGMGLFLDGEHREEFAEQREKMGI